ncbi:hypothetical protein B0H19DRAFT_1072511 [Mycena capillaripes]|nr:hypothetical protein B0H19DRAFT_1072511 [Mycena capillaripes]
MTARTFSMVIVTEIFDIICSLIPFESDQSSPLLQGTNLNMDSFKRVSHENFYDPATQTDTTKMETETVPSEWKSGSDTSSKLEVTIGKSRPQSSWFSCLFCLVPCVRDQEPIGTEHSPLLPLADFCRQYKLNNTTRKYLVRAGFQWAETLLDTNKSVLKDAGLEGGHVAELERALRTCFGKQPMFVE